MTIAPRVQPAKKAPLPESIYLDWTDYCNAKCFFCERDNYERHIGGRGEFIPFAKLKKLETALGAVKYFGISSGIGEPLLHPELKEILDWLYEINPRIQLRVVTNGTTLTGAKAAWFAGHLDWLSVSLNASNAEAHLRDMFPHLVKTGEDAAKRWELQIRRLTEFIAALPPADRKRIRIQAVAHRNNIQDLPDFVRLVARLGASHAVIPNIAAHAQTVDSSLYWVKDAYNDAFDEACCVGAALGVRVDGGRFFTSVKPVLDLDKVCRDPIDIAYISRASTAAPCCQWVDAAIPLDCYEDENGFERYWNNDVLQRLRAKRDFPSCRVCGMSRVFDETSFHLSPKLKQDLIKAKRLSDIESQNDYPDAGLVKACVDNRLDLPSIRRTLLRVGLPVEKSHVIEKEGTAPLPMLDRACWEAFKDADIPVSSDDMALAGPFLGIGWGPPVLEPDRKASGRWLGRGRGASVFVRVRPGANVWICFTLHHFHPPDLLPHVKISIADRVLETRLWTDEIGHTVIGAQAPADLVSAHGGRLWLRVGPLAPDAKAPVGNIAFARLELSETKPIEINHLSRSGFARAVIATMRDSECRRLPNR